MIWYFTPIHFTPLSQSPQPVYFLPMAKTKWCSSSPYWLWLACDLDRSHNVISTIGFPILCFLPNLTPHVKHSHHSDWWESPEKHTFATFDGPHKKILQSLSNLPNPWGAQTTWDPLLLRNLIGRLKNKQLQKEHSNGRSTTKNKKKSQKISDIRYSTMANVPQQLRAPPLKNSLNLGPTISTALPCPGLRSFQMLLGADKVGVRIWNSWPFELQTSNFKPSSKDSKPAHFPLHLYILCIYFFCSLTNREVEREREDDRRGDDHKGVWRRGWWEEEKTKWWPKPVLHCCIDGGCIEEIHDLLPCRPPWWSRLRRPQHGDRMANQRLPRRPRHLRPIQRIPRPSSGVRARDPP